VADDNTTHYKTSTDIKLAVLEQRVEQMHEELKEEKLQRKNLDEVIFKKLDELTKGQEALAKSIVKLGATAVGALAVAEVVFRPIIEKFIRK
jgi:hypothetical protein